MTNKQPTLPPRPWSYHVGGDYIAVYDANDNLLFGERRVDPDPHVAETIVRVINAMFDGDPGEPPPQPKLRSDEDKSAWARFRAVAANAELADMMFAEYKARAG